MSEGTGLLLGAGGAFILVVIGAAWLQSASYRRYLEKVVAENEKLVASQRLTQAAVERQTVALERIAAAIDRRDV